MTHRKPLFATLLAAMLTAAALANPGHHPPGAATPPSAPPMGMHGGTMGADPISDVHGGMMRHMHQMMAAHMQGAAGSQLEGMMNHGAGETLGLDGLADAEFEQAFMSMMIAHRQGAIDMAQLALERASHAELGDLARDIIVAQADEVRQNRAWLDAAR